MRIVAVISLLALISEVEVSQKVIHVRSDTNTLNCSRITCLTIDNLLAKVSFYAKSNTVVQFDSGVYEINHPYGNLLISNVQNLTFRGAVSSADRDKEVTTQCHIVCHQQLAFSFIQVDQLMFQGIRLSHCGSEINSILVETISRIFFTCTSSDGLQLPPCDSGSIVYSSVIAVYHSSNIHIEDILIEQTAGVGLFALGVYEKFDINKVNLVKNMVNCIIATVSPNLLYQYTQELCILNSNFEHGNTSDSRISSGLNLIFSDLERYQPVINMTNITSKNNIGKHGNLVIELNVCQETTIRLVVINFTSIYNISFKTNIFFNQPGIFIKAICYLPFSYQEKSESYLTFEKSVLSNSGIAIQILPQYTSSINIHLKNTVLCCVQDEISMFLRYVHVILTDFKLINASYISIWDSTLKINGTSQLTESRGVLRAVNSTVSFNGNTLITKNINQRDTPIKGTLTFQRANVSFSGNTTIYENFVSPQSCISAHYGSILTFTKGNTVIERNTGYYGGGISLYQGSMIVIEYLVGSEPSSLSLINNTAQYGGGIYIHDYYKEARVAYEYRLVIPCWLTITYSQGVDKNNRLHFEDNRATVAGDRVFGGWLNYCHHTMIESTLFRINIPEIYKSNAGNLLISSKPVRICLCPNSLVPNYMISTKVIRIVPGQSFEVYAMAIGQGYGAVPTTVQVTTYGNSNILKSQKYQSVGKSCTKLIFTAIQLTAHPDEFVGITTGIAVLKVDEDPILRRIIKKHSDQHNSMLEQLSLKLLLLPCFKGYVLNTLTGKCECNEALTRKGIECQIQSGRIRRDKEWISQTILHPGKPQQTNPIIVVHYFCPFDYCKRNLTYFNLEQPDQQCQYNRSGTLCGNCTQNTSAVFGTSKCVLCSNYWVILIIPLVLMAGVGLIVLLTVLNLTVSVGTINGLIFYANIMRANQSVFFPPGENAFLSWFIAWLNLDLGIEMCFYNDMDTFAKTWLQFVFPFYVWFLVILMVTCSHYSTRASRLTANNAVQVLATLFLLSYTKLLRITIVSFSFTTLEYSNGYTKKVWLYDGNVEYIRGRHLALFTAALAVLLFLSIPYTLLLLSTQWLQRCTDYRVLRWIARFKPIFDAYTGPYKTKHRYWTGLLLLVRVLLFLVFSLNVIGDPTINLLAIVTTVLCLLTYSAYLGGVYRKWPLDLLENTFHLNLGICSLVTLYTYATGVDHTQLAYASTGIALTVLIFIILYHIYVRVSNSALMVKIRKSMSPQKKRTGSQDQERSDSKELTTVTAPTSSEVALVELEEPLL